MKSQHNCLFSTLGRHALKLSTAALALAGMTQVASAGTIPYPNSGTPNPTTYTFTAATSGDVVAYFAGTGAAFDEQVGLLDNGVLTVNGYGLDNHSSNLGDSFDFGSVTAGDTLVFVDRITNFDYQTGYAYSDPSLNGPYDGGLGVNHIYSTSAAANQVFPGSPAGTYVGFEDLPAWWPPDYNYFDDTFVFTDVSTQEHSVPDAASTLTLLGFGLTGLSLLRRRLQS